MPSLTLTDPDMILPYNGSERESQTPSPPSQLVYLSNLNARYNSNTPADPHVASNQAGSRSKKNFSRHAWSHEEAHSGRRLSDIGEELSPSRLSGFEEQNGSGSGSGSGPAAMHEQGIASSPVVREELVATRQQNNAWSSSSSTVSAGSARASSSREVSSPSHAHTGSPNPTDGVNTPTTEDELKAVLPDSSAIASAAKGKGPGDEFSSAILSSEAERILENAKRRLTLMEGNLNRARSSVRLTPSPSPSSPGNNQPLGPHQPGGLYRSISHRKGSALRRQSLLPAQDASNNRHARVHSETNFPPETNLSTDTKHMSRSVSAMGSSSVSSFHNDERTFQYDPTRAYLTHRASISSMRQPQIEQTRSPDPVQAPLPEESPEASPTEESPEGLGISAEDESKSNPGNFSPVYSSYGPPSRAQSQLQVRDLQYQMKGLHIKISSLKVRTQEDNLRRRSFQSLRTPSPLTAADPWYQNALELRDGRSSRGSTARRDGSSEYTRESQLRNEGSQSTGPSGHHDGTRRGDSPLEQPGATYTSAAEHHQETGEYDGRQSAADSMYEDAQEGDYEDGDIDREALDEILREPLDEDLASPWEEYPPAEGLPHEEREDAFDYEHFILHSALGNYTRQPRRASHSSHESNETTRPTRSVGHTRTNSGMSDSTVATFATATEGENEPLTEDEDDLLYWDRRFNHELRHRHVPDHHHHDNSNPIIETDRSETPRGSREDDSARPTGDEPQSPQGLHPTGRSSSATTGSATPTSLVSSLVSTVRAASATPTSPTSGGINDDDTQILEQLFQSLGNVCMGLQSITTSPEPDLKAARVLRRRLDAARRVLDGELDA